MKLNEITGEAVLAGKLWIIQPGQEGESNPEVKETIGFTGEDMGLVSAVVRIADGSEHLGLVVKSFPAGGDAPPIQFRRYNPGAPPGTPYVSRHTGTLCPIVRVSGYAPNRRWRAA